MDALPSLELSEREREELLDKYHSLLGAVRHSERNPLEQPVSMARRDLPKLLAEDYVVLRKSDGVRYTLFLTQMASGPVAVLVDRRLALRRLPVASRRDFFMGTVLDCELVQTRGGARRLLAFDALAYKGARVASRPYGHRCALVAECLVPEPSEEEREDPSDFAARERAVRRQVSRGLLVLGASKLGLSLYYKPHVPLRRLEELLSDAGTHESDGLIFVALGRGSKPGTSSSTFKLKAQHTVDLEVAGDKLFCGQGGGPETAVCRVELPPGFVVDDRFWGAARKLVDETGIVECVILPGRVLLPTRCRRDKSHPNTLDVVRRTASDFDECLSPGDVVDFLRESGALS